MMDARSRRQPQLDPDIKHEYRQPDSYDHGAHSHNNQFSTHGQSFKDASDPYTDLVTTASTIHARIKAAALQNSSLLVSLRDTEDAPGALAVKRVLIEKTEDELEKQEQTLQELENMIKELGDKRNGSKKTLRALLHKASVLIAKLRIGHREGRAASSAQETAYDDEIKSQEQMYFDTIAMKSKEDKRKVELQQQLLAVQKDAKEIEPQAEKHGTAHAELDTLYESIFSGPTPGFPEEDTAEHQFDSARANFEEAKGRVLAKRKGIRAMEQTQHNLKLAISHIGYAVTEVENAPFLALSDFKTHLLNLDHYITITNVALEKAVLALAPISAKSHSIAQRLQSNLRKASISPTAKFAKPVLQERLENTKQLLENSSTLLDNMHENAKREELLARNDVRGTAGQLEEKRSNLQQVRQEAFEKVAGYGAAPPAYHNCCSRTDQYEGECDLIVESSPVEEGEGSHVFDANHGENV